MPNHHVILGNGAAGISAAEEIRRHRPDDPITLISDEPHRMYSRPGLAYVLTGEISEPNVFCRTAEDYRLGDYDLVHARVARLELDKRQVRLEGGDMVSFDRLLLATGATAVRAAFPGSGLDGVVYLDNLRNVQDILRRVREGAKTAVVVGGGITAMELAEGLAEREVEVHYLLRKEAIWSALLTDAESRIVESQARMRGIHLHFREEITEVTGAQGRVTGVWTTGGAFIPCQIVGAAIGVRPNLAPVRGTAIRMERGILVNEYLESSVPGVYAAGDVAQVFDPASGEARVDDLWHSALSAGRAAGANMAGVRTPYLRGVAFNAARVFGMHLTAMGQAGAGHHDEDDPNETLQYQSRGSSETWWARPGGPYASAWASSGMNSLRLVLRGEQIAGAVLLGSQDLANPLRDLVAHRVNISPIHAQLQKNDPALGEILRAFHQEWRRTRPGVLT